MDAAIAEKIEAHPELLAIPWPISRVGWRKVIPRRTASSNGARSSSTRKRLRRDYNACSRFFATLEKRRHICGHLINFPEF